MKRSSSLVFLGALLVALAALFTLCFHIQILLPNCRICLEIKDAICPIWWVVQ
jgi:hypothetical protein